jgi:hypothetical protein
MKPQDMHDYARAILAAPPARTAPTLAEKVDRLGEIKAAQADLQTEYDRIRAELEAAGLPAIDGHNYRATFSTSTRSATDWAAIARRLKASAQLIRAYTTTSEPATACRVTARKTTH